MRPVAALLILNTLYLFAGFGLLYGLGLTREPRAALRHGGLALVVGFVGVSALIALLLTAGSLGGVLASVLVAVSLATAGLVVGRHVRGVEVSRRPRASSRLDRVVVGGSIAALIVYYGALLWRALLSDGAAYWDPWWFWLPKARTIVLQEGLEAGPGGFTSWANPDYPPLVPGFDALVFRFVGTIDLRSLAVELWVLEVAFLLGAAALLARRVPPPVMWPLLTLVAVLPSFRYLVGSFLADEILVMEFALAALCAAFWVLERQARWAALCTLLLAAAVLTKNEGLLLYIVLVPLVISLTASRRTLWPLAALAAVPPLVLLPWKLWLRAHDVPPTPTFQATDLLDFEYLANRGGRLGDAAADLASILVDPDYWLVLVPIVLAGVLACAFASPRLALLEGGLLMGGFGAIVVVYWASPYDLEYLINTSASRVVSPIAVAAALLLPLLIAEALVPRRSFGPTGSSTAPP
jgi:hypothetical protein